MTDKEQGNVEVKKKRSPWRWLWRFILILLLIILLLPLLLHFTPFQNWLVDKSANRISKKTNSTVEVGSVDFSIFKGFVFEDVYISNENAPADTLLQIGSFSSSLTQNILSVIENKVRLRDIKLEGTHFYIKTEKGEQNSNLEKFFSNLSQSKSSGSSGSKPLDIQLGLIAFKDIHIKVENENDLKFLSIDLKSGNIDIKSIDLKNDSFQINKLELLDPIVKMGEGLEENKTIVKVEDETNQEAKDSTNAKDSISVSQDSNSELYVGLQELLINGGAFSLDNWNKPLKSDTGNPAIDYDHLSISSIDIDAQSLELRSPLDIELQVNKLSLKENGGFEIEKLEVGKLHFNKKALALEELSLRTNNSKIEEYLEFNYNDFSDFKDFAKNIKIISAMSGSKIALSDLNYFFPDLYKSSFFKINKNRSLYLTGIVNGTIDNLEADNLFLTVDNLVELSGALSTISLTDPSKALINMYVDEFNTSLANLKMIIPGFNPPEQFYKLDPIQFTGDIEGFFNDFVIYGSLKSNLGIVNLDSRLDTKNGIDGARYSGEIALKDFDVKTWTGNSDFGLATLSARIEDGQGLTLESVKTDMRADLEHFEFKDYHYNNISLAGLLEKNLFNGAFTADDPNLSLDFDGTIDLKDKKVKSDFIADIKQIDLTALNLSKDFTSINGKIDLSVNGSTSDDFYGGAKVKNLELVYKEKSFVFDSLNISSSPDENNSRNLIVNSDLINANIEGYFDFAEIGPAFSNLIYHNHPGWAKKLNINKRQSGIVNAQQFEFDINISDTKDYLELANVKDLRFKGVTFRGNSDLKNEKVKSVISIDTTTYKNLTFDKLDVNMSNDDVNAEILIDLHQIETASKAYEPMSFQTIVNGDEIELRLKTNNVLDSVGQMDIGMSLIPVDDKIVANFKNQDLYMFSTNWEVEENNKIIYGDKYLEFSDLKLSDGYRNIILDDLGNKGVSLALENFDFLLINGLINYDKIDFTGEGNVKVKVVDLFEKPQIDAMVRVPEFLLNGVNYGELRVDAVDREDGVVDALVSLERMEDNMSYVLDVGVNRNTKEIDGDIIVKNGVLSTFEFIIDEGISDTKGTVDIEAKVSGNLDDLKMRGEAEFVNGGTRVDYLGSYMDFGSEKVRITERFINFTGVKIYDKFKNEAVMRGGIHHDLFTDLTTELTMTSDRFLALDTEEGHDAAYYGTCFGNMTVNFFGPFSTMDIRVDGTTGEGTVLNIPIQNSYSNFEESFIKFVDRDTINLQKDTAAIVQGVELEGVDIEMNFTLTEDANVNIIFDERLNDVIKGTGNGDLRIVVSREGDFNIFGDYEVESGEYLFTAWGIVAKPFKVKRGGTITWTGDPINATLNLEAEYDDLSAPTHVFLAEYFNNNSNLEREAKKRTKVDLSLQLNGTLYNPEVNFDIDLPELQGELRTYADSKLRTLREDDADLNEQVAGLIMFRSFLPSNSFGNVLSTGSSFVQTGYNTLSEFVSSQLSYFLSGFLQEALAESGFVSGIDFEIGFNKNSSVLDGNTNTDNFLPDEVEVHFKPRFQNDKWGFDYGTSFVNAQNSPNTTTNYVIHDFVLEYYLTDDKRLKLRAYGKWDKDEVEFQNEQRYGLGINYRKEFGNLTDFQKSLSQDLLKIKSAQIQGGQ